jgi:lauroyl/myristoyl acyltransferase
MALPLELLHAIRQGEIVSIQGDRAVAHVSQRPARLFGEEVQLPDGPFMLALVSQAPIYPLFIVRSSFHHYKIIARAPIDCRRSARDRGGVVKEAMRNWCCTLEGVIASNWSQWFSLVPIFPER